jgi:hypothetical protein
MKDFLLVLASIALTALCWGVYGPLMREGQTGMGGHLLPFICVGIAYFLIAVLVPIGLLQWRGESGRWTTTGVVWSFGAGTITAVGALGVILALTAGGMPIYVMPLVFGGAPVVNTFVSMYIAKTYRQAGPLFYAGLLLVIAGAVTILVFNPAAKRAEAISLGHLAEVLAFVALTVVTWGAYGPVLHKGQVAMQGSRMRPLLCVGLAYFLIAVLVPLALRAVVDDHGHWTFNGTLWSLAGGAAGALGSLGVILAFTFGGKPVYVMPLVFGFAPVINTLTSIATAPNLGEVHALFYAGLIVVVTGAVTVLVFAPKPARGHTPAAVPGATRKLGASG